MANTKEFYALLYKSLKDAIEAQSSFMIFPEIFVWQIKPGFFGITRNEGCFPITVAKSLTEAVYESVVQLKKDIEIVDTLGLAPNMPFHKKKLHLEYAGKTYDSHIDDLLEEAKARADMRNVLRNDV